MIQAIELRVRRNEISHSLHLLSGWKRGEKDAERMINIDASPTHAVHTCELLEALSRVLMASNEAPT
jgi:hypothetical protein